MSAAEVVAAAHELYNNANKDADTWLRKWQQSPESWQTAHHLLSDPTVGLTVHYLAAQTLRTKVMFDFVELPLDCHRSLCDSILGHIVKHIDGPRTVASMLSLALADLSVQTAATWPNPVETAVTALSECKSPNARKRLLDFLKMIPEESIERRVMVDPSSRETHHKILESSAPSVLAYLGSIRTEVAVKEDPELFTPLTKRFIPGDFFLDMFSSTLYESPILQDCFDPLCSPDASLPEAAANCLTEILKESSANPLRHSPFLGIARTRLLAPESPIRALLVSALQSSSSDFLTTARVGR
eukprot:Selendium_serpulae@DN10956_c0_g1_i1.p1